MIPQRDLSLLSNRLAKEARYKKLWHIRLETQLAELPEFSGVYRAVQRALRQAGFFKS